MAEITVGVSVTRRTVAEASDEAAGLTSALLNAVKSHGVQDRDLKTTNYTVMAEYDHRSQPARLVGYRVDSALAVIVRNLEQFPAVLAAATEAGGDATTIGGIRFGHQDPSALVTEARELAWNDAVAAAVQLAELAGRRLGSVRRIVEGGPRCPRPQPALTRGAVMEAASVPIEGGTVSQDLRIEVDFELE